jgi:hypothetical protein
VGSAESVTSMPLPLAEWTWFRCTRTWSLRAPMKIAEAGPGNCLSPTRARALLLVSHTREVA